MRKIATTLFLLLTGFAIYSYAQIYILEELNETISNSYEENAQDQTVDSSGDIAVVYSDNNDNYILKVKKKDSNNNQRNILGPQTLPTVIGYTPSIASDHNNNYYVAYSDESAGIQGRCSVIKRDGSNRSYLGGQGHSNNSTYYHSITVDNNDIPYVLFTDYGDTEQLIVQRRTNSSWETIGSGSDFTITYTTNDDYGIDQFIKTAPDGTIYIGYISSDNKNLILYQRNGSNRNSIPALNISDFDSNYTINSMDFTIADNGEIYALIGAKGGGSTPNSSIIVYKFNNGTRTVIDDDTSSSFISTTTHRANSIILEKTTNYPIISYLKISTSLQVNGETSYVKKRNGLDREIEDEEYHGGINYVLGFYNQILSIDPLGNIHRTERGNSSDGFQYSKLILAYKTYFENFNSNYRYTVLGVVPEKYKTPINGIPNIPLNTPIKLYIGVANDFVGHTVTSPLGNIKIPISKIVENTVTLNTKFFKSPK